MTKEEKQLLLIILCEMMPYGVKGIITYDESNTIFTVEGIDNNVLHLSDAEECYVEDFKPYLRPMSSMTEEEVKEFYMLLFRVERLGIPDISKEQNAISLLYDWLNRNMFDYRGLIPKGLAIEVTKENNPYKN